MCKLLQEPWKPIKGRSRFRFITFPTTWKASVYQDVAWRPGQSPKICYSRCTKWQIMRVEILCSETSHIIHHWKDLSEGCWCKNRSRDAARVNARDVRTDGRSSHGIFHNFKGLSCLTDWAACSGGTLILSEKMRETRCCQIFNLKCPEHDFRAHFLSKQANFGKKRRAFSVETG